MRKDRKLIRIRNARVNNLQNISLDLPREKFIVVTGLSGSGKSSLAFDTLYAEGRRRYVESLSTYVRQFLGQIEKPDVDSIDGLCPAIAIDQKTTSKNPRSTVGTVTEIYDYLRLLYARLGDIYCPNCDIKLEAMSVDQIIENILALPNDRRLYFLAPLAREKKGSFQKELTQIAENGFLRIRLDGEIYQLDDLPLVNKNKKHSLDIVIDRLRNGDRARIADSVELALKFGNGQIIVLDADDEQEYLYSQFNTCPKCDFSIDEISPKHFSFNSPLGACPSCAGLGYHQHFHIDDLVGDKNKSINEGAIRLPGFMLDDENSWMRGFIEALALRYDFSLDTPFKDLSDEIKQLIFYGNKGEKLKIDTSRSKYDRGDNYYASFAGIIPILAKRYREASSEEVQSKYEEYMVLEECDLCRGARLKRELLAIKLAGKNIYEFNMLNIASALQFLDKIKETLQGEKLKIASKIFEELKSKLHFLLDVGLNYMTLSRPASTLSGGESQRIRLATQLGSGLTGVLYILDEPSIGLHQRDNDRLIKTLKNLRDLDNTLVVVEHDHETMEAADYLVDIGPLAGENGGRLIYSGPPSGIKNCQGSITGAYLSGREKISVPQKRRKANSQFIKIYGARQNNLQNINLKIPLSCLVAVTGVSGSGKSSLINGILLPELIQKLSGDKSRKKVKVDKIELPKGCIDKVIAIDQSPIGKTPRSNPATYTGAFDSIRQIFAETKAAKAKGFKPGRFSFNTKGGRCEACQGDGVKKIEMHFMSDIYVKCDICKGRRYNHETLDIKFKGKDIAEVLDFTVDEAYDFFREIAPIERKLKTLQKVGLGYIRLGQSSTTLSGGEAQRIKLAYELAKKNTGKTIYILDEPTTGLHIADTHQLVKILHDLVDAGNTVIVIEHNLDLIKTADWIVDMGPEGGDEGGICLFSGPLEKILACENSYTAKYLAKMIGDNNVRS